MLLSDFLKSGATLQGKAGPAAINSNDILEMNIQGYLKSAKVLDYAAASNAGTTPMASTTFSSYSSLAPTVGQNCAVQAGDGAVFVIDSAAAGQTNLTVFKYTPAGALLGSIDLDPGVTIGATNPQIALLSSGNLVALWYNASGGSGVYAAVLDQSLDVVAAKTNIGTAGVNPGPNLALLALTGGGFAATWTAPAGISYAIYSNTLTAVQSATTFSGTPAQTSGNLTGIATSMANLSNGSIGVAFADTNTHALGYAVLTAAGVATVNYTNIAGGVGGGGGASAASPAISALAGYFCVSPGRAAAATAGNAYVFSNAGVQQGSAYNPPGSGTWDTVLTNDGTYFWQTAYNGTNTIASRIATTGGAGALATALSNSFQPYATWYENGYIIVSALSTIYTYQVNAAGYVNQWPVIAGVTSGAGGSSVIPVGDDCALSVGSGVMQVTKYLSSSVVGVSQSTLAAGNVGTVISYTMGPGAYPCNPLLGTQNKAFDHSSMTVIGNKGTFLGNAVSLKGI